MVKRKIGIGVVMLVCSRKIAYRYVDICIGCSVDHHGLFLFFFDIETNAQAENVATLLPTVSNYRLICGICRKIFTF